MLHANQIGANAVAQGAPKRSGLCSFTEARGARRSKPGPRIAALWFENQAVGICRAEGFELVRSRAARAGELGCPIDPRAASAKRRCANPRK